MAADGASRPPVGVVLFNMGGPETLAQVRPFLTRLFSDREIIRLPAGPVFQPLFARLLAWGRSPAVRRNYASIGGGSPQLRHTLAQASALEARLNCSGAAAGAGRPRANGRYVVRVAMRYSQPDAPSALEQVVEAGAGRIVTLTLYPQYSRATTGSFKAAFDRELARPRWRGRFRVTSIDAYPEEPLYLEAVAETVRRGIAQFSPGRRDGVAILFSAHGLPQRFVEAGDPYVQQTAETIAGVLERLQLPNRHAVGYQSRTGPVRWTGPGTEEVLRALAAEGVRDVLVVPVSFVSDHIETLYEVDQLFRETARACGIDGYRRSEALNDHPVFVEALARLVERHLEGEA